MKKQRPIEILLVEDSPTDRLMAIEAVKEAKIINNMHIVENGVDALAFLRREGKFAGAPWPDLILLDLNLPRKDGREVLIEVKSDPVLRFIPVVVMTTSSAEDDVVMSYGNHASSFIRKPMDFAQFAQSVRLVGDYWFQVVTLPNEEAVRRMARPRQPVEAATANARLKVLLIEDSPTDAMLVRQYLQLSPHAAFDVTRVSRFAEVRALGDLQRFDVVLTDLSLPDSQGADTFRAARRLFPDQPLVVLTGLDDEDQGLQLTREGADDYLVKQDMSPSMLVRTIRHVVDKHRVQVQLRHSQRLEAFGQLSAGVAHDFNNLLTVIQGQTALLDLLPALPAEARSSVADIAEATKRAATLTRQLLTFSRRSVMRVQNIDVNVQLGASAQLVRRLLSEEITLELQLTAAQATVEADTNMLEQVVMNLAVNARDAMPNGGKVTLATSVVDVGADATAPGAYAGRFVQISLADTGAGIPEDVLPRIFEPFYTTKGLGVGTGLGLATVMGIVQQHRGFVHVDSQIGRGTRFDIHLPFHDAKPAQLPQARPMPLVGGSERILFVEDEDVLRRSFVRILARAGYEVLTAASGAEALAVWKQQEGRIDLVFTDLVMPGMGGLALAEALRAIRPDVKIVFASGYSPDFTAQPGLLVEGRTFLHKPYTAAELMRLLRARLDET